MNEKYTMQFIDDSAELVVQIKKDNDISNQYIGYIKYCEFSLHFYSIYLYYFNYPNEFTEFTP